MKPIVRDGKVVVELTRRERILLYLSEQVMPEGRYDGRGFRRTVEPIAEAAMAPTSSTYETLNEMVHAGDLAHLPFWYSGQVKKSPARFVTKARMYTLTRAGEALAAFIRGQPR
jgi:hypothetical protein